MSAESPTLSSPARPGGWARTWCARSRRRARASGASCTTRTKRRCSSSSARRSRSSSATSATPRRSTGSSTASARRHGLPHRGGHPPAEADPRASSTSTSAAPSWSSTGPAAPARTRFVHVSSNSPFGANPRPTDRFTEDSPYNPYMGYGQLEARGRAARAAEPRPRRRRDRHRPGAVVLRPATSRTARPSSSPRSRKGRFPLVGDGTQQRSMAYTGNLVHGLLLRRDGAGARRAARTGSPTPSPTSCAEILATVRAALAAEGLPVAEGQPQLPRARGRGRRRTLDGLLQRRGPLRPGAARARRAEGHDRLRHHAAPAPSSATTRRRACSRACGRASAGASSAGDTI